MLDLDLLLTIVGLSLVAIGVVVFLLGKSRAASGSERSNIFEAFGIKLDVSNPSILLIMFGVVLMLTPRFVPLGNGPGAAAEPELPAVTSPAEPEAQPAAAPAMPAAQPAEGGPDERRAEQDAARQAEQQAEQQAAREMAEQVARSEAEAAAQRARELAELEAQRQAVAREQAALAAERARVAALASRPPPQPRAPPARPEVASKPVAPPLPRLAVLTEALNYEGQSAASLRSKLHAELRAVAGGVLAEKVSVESQNTRFRELIGAGDMTELCKRTQAQHLLLADLTPVAVFDSRVPSANWPEMRYSAVDCGSGKVSRSDWIRMEPTVGDSYPLQQSVVRSGREFIRDNRHLLQ